MSVNSKGLMPLSVEELNSCYGGLDDCTCGHTAGKEAPYNSDCCWHDCKKADGMGGSFMTHYY